MESGVTDIQHDDHDLWCTLNRCKNDDDQYKLMCSECKRLVHYRCTSLPAYQIEHFMTRNYRKFVCTNCTTVPEYIADIFSSDQDTNKMKSDDIEELRATIERVTTEKEVLKESNLKLTKKVNEVRQELERKNERSKKGKIEHNKLQTDVKKMKSTLKNYQDEIITLNTTVEEQESELKEMHTWHGTSTEMVERDTLMDKLQEKFNDMERKQTDHIQKAINESFKRIEERIDKSINDKISNNNDKVEKKT